MLSGERKEKLGMPEPPSWPRMVHLAANIYKKLTPAQKYKLVDMGILQPDFEDVLLDLFSTYLAMNQIFLIITNIEASC
jgi:hypothetical protein